jgi:hypothetical protein
MKKIFAAGAVTLSLVTLAQSFPGPKPITPTDLFAEVGPSNFEPMTTDGLFNLPPTVTHIKSMLWVGNSFFYYNNSMHVHVHKLLNAANQRGHRSYSATIRGASLNSHEIEPLLRPEALNQNLFVADDIASSFTFERPFDTVIMMDCSYCPIHSKQKSNFYEFSKKHSDAVRSRGAEPIFFMSWAYADRPNMTQALASEYVRVGKLNNALVVPAGYSFADSIAKRPDIGLLTSDKRHPSIAGTYLAACTVLASVYKINPVGNKYTAGLSEDVALHLQSAAWETTQIFHAREGRGSLP